MTISNLKQLNELQLIKIFKRDKNDQKTRDKVYSIFYSRYYKFLRSEGSRLFSKIDSSYFSMDELDCENQANYCLKVALDWFDESKFKGDKNLFSIAPYVKLQIDARISSYYWKQNKKIKKNIDQNYYPDLNHIVDDERVGQQEKSLLSKELDERLNDQQRKLKNYLMEGVKEYRIKNIMGINNKEYFLLKEKLKETMISIGYC